MTHAEFINLPLIMDVSPKVDSDTINVHATIYSQMCTKAPENDLAWRSEPKKRSDVKL